MLVTGRTVTGGTASDLKRTIVRLRRFTQVALMPPNTRKTTVEGRNVLDSCRKQAFAVIEDS
jgi:hypothetical protein